MTHEADPEILAYLGVLDQWKETPDCVQFKGQPQEFIRGELGCTQKQFVEAMRKYALASPDKVKKVVEVLEQWRDEFPYRFELRFPFPRAGDHPVYVESVIDVRSDPYFSTVTVVKLKYKDEELNRRCKFRT